MARAILSSVSVALVRHTVVAGGGHSVIPTSESSTGTTMTGDTDPAARGPPETLCANARLRSERNTTAASGFVTPAELATIGFATLTVTDWPCRSGGPTTRPGT